MNNSDEYQELRLIIHELAFKSKQIYEKALNDEKRLLLSQLFTNFTQNRDEVKPNYNLACEYLLEWIPKLNESYEQQKMLAKQALNAQTGLVTSALLPPLDTFRTIKLASNQE